MNSLFLRILNAPLLLLIFSFLTAVQTVLFSYPWVRHFQPDLNLVGVVWFALKRSFLEGGILVLLLGYIAELHSACPRGYFLMIYLIIFLMLRLASQYLSLPEADRGFSLLCVVCVLDRFFSLILLTVLDLTSPATWFESLLSLPLFAMVSSSLGVLLAQWLHRLDWNTGKNPKAQQSFDDEIFLENEGF